MVRQEALRHPADALSVYALEALGKEPYGELARLYALRFLQGESLSKSAQRPALYDPW